MQVGLLRAVSSAFFVAAILLMLLDGRGQELYGPVIRFGECLGWSPLLEDLSFSSICRAILKLGILDAYALLAVSWCVARVLKHQRLRLSLLFLVPLVVLSVPGLGTLPRILDGSCFPDGEHISEHFLALQGYALSLIGLMILAIGERVQHTADVQQG